MKAMLRACSKPRNLYFSTLYNLGALITRPQICDSLTVQGCENTFNELIVNV